MLGLSFSSKLDWSSYIICIAKTAPKKIGAFIHSMKFLSPEAALYLYKSSIWLCMEYCCLVMSWLVLLAVTWKYQISYKIGYIGLVVLDVLSLLNPWDIVEIEPA